MVRRANKAKTALLALLMLISVTLLLPAGLTESDAKESTSLWGRVVDDKTNKPIEGAAVTITNLQTGQTYDLLQKDGQYRLEDKTGYFEISASAPEYFDVGKGHNETLLLKDDIQKKVLQLKKVTKDLKLYGNVTYFNGTANVTLNSTYLHLTCIDGEFRGYEDSTLNNETGYFEFEVFPGEFLLSAREEGYVNHVGTVTVNKGEDREYLVDMTEGEVEYEVYGFAEDDDTGARIEGLYTTLVDLDNDITTVRTFNNTDYFHFEVYPANFRLVIDADGYHPRVIENEINITETNSSWWNYISLEKDKEDELTINVTMLNKELSGAKVFRDWRLNSDSTVPGLSEGPGNLKMKIDGDERFGNDDGKLNSTEVNEFKKWFKRVGPKHLYTGGVLTVNGTEFVPDFLGDSSELNYTPVLYNFTGDVTDIKGLRITTTMFYNIEEEIEDSGAYEVWLGGFGADYTVDFGNEYEIITEDNADWDLLLDDDNETIPNQAWIYNATTLEVFRKVKPVANITVVINEEEFYSGDIIYAGSAADDTIAAVDYENITFDASSSFDEVGGIVNYTWDFGDGEKGYGETVTHNYSVADGKTEEFGVILTLLDSAGEVNELEGSRINIVVDATPPSIDLAPENMIKTPPAKRNQSEPIEFNASAVTDDTELPESASSFVWDPEKMMSKFGKTVEFFFDEAGETYVNFTARDKVGNEKKVTLNLEIKDTEPPRVSVLGPITARAGEALALNATDCVDNVDDLDNLSFEWDFNNSLVNSRTNTTTLEVEPTFDEPGTYVVRLNVTDRSNNSAVAEHTVTITASDLIIIQLEVSDLKPTENEEVTVKAVVKNEGAVETEGFTVALYVGEGADEDEVATTNVVPMGIEEEITVNLTWKASPAGEQKLRVVVDSANDVIEDDEDNNEDSILVTVQEGRSYLPLIIVIGLIAVAIVVFIVLKKKRGLG